MIIAQTDDSMCNFAVFMYTVRNLHSNELEILTLKTGKNLTIQNQLMKNMSCSSSNKNRKKTSAFSKLY